MRGLPVVSLPSQNVLMVKYGMIMYVILVRLSIT